jgi:hypothetical protein
MEAGLTGMPSGRKSWLGTIGNVGIVGEFAILGKLRWITFSGRAWVEGMKTPISRCSASTVMERKAGQSNCLDRGPWLSI